MAISEDEEFEGSKLTLIEHLEELRKRLITATLALLVATMLSFVITGRLLEILLIPSGGIKPVFLKPTEMFITYFKVAMIAGAALSMPVIVNEVIRFIVPGLKPDEKRYLFFVIPGATFLFVLGETSTRVSGNSSRISRATCFIASRVWRTWSARAPATAGTAIGGCGVRHP